MRGLSRAELATIIGCLAVGASTFAPWARSGARIRNSYELLDAATRAQVLPEAIEALAPLWLAVPILCGAAIVAVATHRRTVAAVLASTLALLVVIGGLLVLRSPLGTEPGVPVGFAAGAVTAISAGLLTPRGENDE